MVYLFSPSLGYELYTGIMSHGLNRILNNFVVFNVYITVKVLPILAWSPTLIDLLEQCKDNIITSTLLLRYDSSKPVFLKIDWSAGGIGYILMQPANLHESLIATTQLEFTSECLSILHDPVPI